MDDYIKIASPNNIPISNNSRTISLWTKPNIHKDNLWIWWGDANSNQGNGLRLFTGEKIRFYFWSNDLDVYTGDLTNKWHHIVAIYDNITNKQKVYVDGQLKEERTPSIPNTMNSDLYIGMRPDTEHFNGLLNNVQIYNQSIPDSEIKQNYIAGLSSMFANGSMSKEEYSERIKALAIK